MNLRVVFTLCVTGVVTATMATAQPADTDRIVIKHRSVNRIVT
jgi:hypothetical protein